MSAALQQLIEEFQGRSLPDLTQRDLVLPEAPDVATVLIGMRRSGKTYTLYQEMQRLLDEGVDKRCLLYLNLEDDRLGVPTLETLSKALETFYRMNPEARAKRAYLFFDEIQVVPEWSRFARRILDTERVRLYLTGSSAKLLSTEVATEFRGRGSAVEVLPFSYVESARHAGIGDLQHPIGSTTRSRMEAHLDFYLKAGGFPAVQGLDEVERIHTLQDYVELVVVRDVIERYGGPAPHIARWFALALLRQSGSLFSVNKIYNTMRSQGFEVSKDTLYGLLDHLADAYLLAPVSIFKISHSERSRARRKIYAIDSGLAFAISTAAAKNIGARLETAVYVELRRRFGRLREGAISYYLTEGEHEVDFVVGDVDADEPQELIQVCADLTKPETMDRERRSLEEAMRELGIHGATIVSLFHEESIRTDAGDIEVIPAWKWFSGIRPV